VLLRRLPDLVIEPLVGVGGIKFGFHLSQVIALLGDPERVIRGKRLLYSRSALQVHLDDSEHVHFVEIGASDSLRPILDGIAVLDVSAQRAIDALAFHGAVNRAHPEFPRLCIVPEAELSLWRSTLPAEDPRGERFESVGAGRAGYFSMHQAVK